MMAKTTLILAAVALAACAPMGGPRPRPVGQQASASPSDRLVAAIEAEGCLFNQANAGAVLLRANLTSAEAQPLILALGQQGRVEASGTDGGSTVRLLSDNCI